MYKGTILDIETKETILGATISVTNFEALGTNSDETGSFNLNLPIGTHELIIQYIGYESKAQIVKVFNNGTLKLELTKQSIDLETITVSTKKQDANIDDAQIGITSLDVKEVRKAPSFLGEADIIKNLLLKPGISSIGEGAAGFNVRGGEVDQNLLLLDEGFLFNSSHALGFFSTFNTDIISSVDLFKSIIPFYNDIKQDIGNLSLLNQKNVINQINSESEKMQINIEFDKEEYRPKDLVTINIKLRDYTNQLINGNLSVTVTDAIAVNQPPVIIEQGGINISNNPQIIIKGNLLDNRKKNTIANVLGIYDSMNKRFLYNKTDKEGNYQIPLSDFYESKNYQFIGYQLENTNIQAVIQEPNFPLIKKSLTISLEIIEYLKLSYQRKKILNTFSIKKENFKLVTNENKKKEKQEKIEPNFTYIIKEYENFDEIHDFFGELMTPLTFRLKTNGTYFAQLTNPSANSTNLFLPEKPLFIIDGKLTRNADYIAKLKLDYIESISLFYKRNTLKKFFGPLGLSGVVNIKTTLRDITIPKNEQNNIITINGLQKKAIFPNTNYQKNNSSFPQFKSQLYWKPSIETDNDGFATISFYQPDNTGEFTIQVVARSQYGNLGVKAKTYKSYLPK